MTDSVLSILCALQRDSYSRKGSPIVSLESATFWRVRQWNVHCLLKDSKILNLHYESLILLLAVCADNHLLLCFLLLGPFALLASRGSTGSRLAGGPPVLQVLILMWDVLLILLQLEDVLHLELLEVLINILHLVEVVVININDLLRDVINLVDLSGVILVQKTSLLDHLLGISFDLGS